MIPAGDGELAVLITPFVFALAPDQRERMVFEATRVLDPESYWLLTEPDPAAMPGYWLYQVFPAARRFDLDRRLSAGGLYQLLQTYGFAPTLKRKTWQQPLTGSILTGWVEQRQAFHQLTSLTDVDYQAGLEKLEGKTADLPPSQMVVLSTVAILHTRPDG